MVYQVLVVTKFEQVQMELGDEIVERHPLATTWRTAQPLTGAALLLASDAGGWMRPEHGRRRRCPSGVVAHHCLMVVDGDVDTPRVICRVRRLTQRCMYAAPDNSF